MLQNFEWIVLVRIMGAPNNLSAMIPSEKLRARLTPFHGREFHLASKAAAEFDFAAC